MIEVRTNLTQGLTSSQLSSSLFPKSKLASSINDFEKKLDVEKKLQRQALQVLLEKELLDYKKAKQEEKINA